MFKNYVVVAVFNEKEFLVMSEYLTQHKAEMETLSWHGAFARAKEDFVKGLESVRMEIWHKSLLKNPPYEHRFKFRTRGKHSNECP